MKSTLALLLLLSTVTVEAEERWEEIWKYQVPAGVAGEFGNEDPVGLAASKHIRTDCGIRWVADDGKNYCFNSGTSLQYFLDKPGEYLKRARDFWLSEQKTL